MGWALAWSASRALPLLAAVLLLYLLAVTGIVARPPFPFDPSRFRVGAGQIVAMAFLAIVTLAGYYAIRGWRVPAGLPSEVAAPALGLVSAFAVLVAWLANPYLALLLVPLAHVWLLDARRGGAFPWPLTLGAIAVSLLPIAAAVVHVAGSLDLGAGAPWQLLLMVGDGQIGFGSMLALCLLGGTLVGLVALALRPLPAHPEARLAARGWAASPAAPDRAPSTSRLGNDLDASPIAPRAADDDLADEA